MQPACPLPTQDFPAIQLGHGGGGTMMRRLLDQMILPAFSNPLLDQNHDGAVFGHRGGRIAFTTDSYVVKPRFFSGGDIGSLAVYGTVNDLAMCGARPAFLSCGLIIEEGFDSGELRRVAESMRAAARECGAQIVTGDTKVVERGHGDGLYVNTAGIGFIEHDWVIAPASVRPGDVILLSGDLGRHGIAIMAERENLRFETAVVSDCAPLHGAVGALLEAGVPVHCLRDLTRGGLVAALKEIATVAGLEMEIREAAIPVSEGVRGACELLGLDPLHVANEGRMIAIVPEEAADAALAAMRGVAESAGSVVIGRVGSGRSGRIVLESLFGTKLVLDMLPGEQLPRIC